jgi:hypothetical protein
VWEFVRKIAKWLDEHAVDPPKRSREDQGTQLERTV